MYDITDTIFEILDEEKEIERNFGKNCINTIYSRTKLEKSVYYSLINLLTDFNCDSLLEILFKNQEKYYPFELTDAEGLLEFLW